jgi:hypothetical protein
VVSVRRGAARGVVMWVAIGLAVVAGVIGVIAGRWLTVVLAGLVIVFAVLPRLMDRSARSRR